MVPAAGSKNKKTVRGRFAAPLHSKIRARMASALRAGASVGLDPWHLSPIHHPAIMLFVL